MSNKPNVYEEDGKVFYRASALGGCLISLAAARQGLEVKPHTEKMQELFDAGHTAEEDLLSLFPNLLTSRQMEVQLPVTGRISVIGHIDGLHEQRLGEVKSQSDDEYDKWKPSAWVDNPLWQKYAWQVSPYMLAVDRELALIRVKRSNPEEFDIWVVEKPFHTLDEIRDRILAVESLAAEDTLQCLGPFSYPCPYHYLHVEVEEQLVTDEALIDAVDRYVTASDNIKRLEEFKNEARDYIRMFLESQTEAGKCTLPNGIKLSRSEFDRKEKVIPAGHEVRVTVTRPK